MADSNEIRVAIIHGPSISAAWDGGLYVDHARPVGAYRLLPRGKWQIAEVEQSCPL